MRKMFVFFLCLCMIFPLSFMTNAEEENTSADFTGRAEDDAEYEDVSDAPPENDTTPPVLTLLDGDKISLYEGYILIEPGYVAIDDVDGDITSEVVVTGTVNSNVLGVYTLTYSVSDSAGNKTEAKRVIEVIPLPIIEPEEPEEPETNFFEPEIPTTNNLQDRYNYDKPEIIKEAETAPDISLVGSNPIILHVGGSPYTEQGVYAYDEIDGDISGNSVISGDVNTDAEGVYTVNYSVTNSKGLTSTISRTVRVLAPTDETLYTFEENEVPLYVSSAFGDPEDVSALKNPPTADSNIVFIIYFGLIALAASAFGYFKKRAEKQ